jgi:hypothetical protein
MNFGQTVLHLRAPELGLGEAAPKSFEQESLFPGVALSDHTALELVGKMIRELRREDLSSDLYDRSLPNKISKWKGLLEGDLSSLDFPTSQHNGSLHVFSDRYTYLSLKTRNATKG